MIAEIDVVVVQYDLPQYDDVIDIDDDEVREIDILDEILMNLIDIPDEVDEPELQVIDERHLLIVIDEIDEYE